MEDALAEGPTHPLGWGVLLREIVQAEKQRKDPMLEREPLQAGARAKRRRQYKDF